MIRRIFKVVAVSNDLPFLEEFFSKYGGEGFNNIYGKVIGTDFQILRLESSFTNFILQFWKFYLTERFFHLIDILLQGASSLVILYHQKDDEDPQIFLDFLKRYKEIYLSNNLTFPLIYFIGIPYDSSQNTTLENTSSHAKAPLKTGSNHFMDNPWVLSFFHHKKQEIEEILQHPVQLHILHDSSKRYVHGIFMELSIHMLLNIQLPYHQFQPIEFKNSYHKNLQTLISQGYHFHHPTTDLKQSIPEEGMITVKGPATNNFPIQIPSLTFIRWVLDEHYDIFTQRVNEKYNELQFAKTWLITFLKNLEPYVLRKPKITNQLSLQQFLDYYPLTWEFYHKQANITVRIPGDILYSLIIKNQLIQELNDLDSLLVVFSQIKTNLQVFQTQYQIHIHPSPNNPQEFFSNYFTSITITLLEHPDLTIKYPFKEFIRQAISAEYNDIIQKIKEQIWKTYRIQLLTSLFEFLKIPVTQYPPHYFEIKGKYNTYLVDYNTAKAYIKGQSTPLCILPSIQQTEFNLMKVPQFKNTFGFESFTLPPKDVFLLSIILSLAYEDYYADNVLFNQLI